MDREGDGWRDHSGVLVYDGYDVEAARAGSASPASGGRSSRIGTYEWLQNEESKRMMQLKVLKTREEEKLAEECTFQPRINKAPASGGKRLAKPAHERLATNRRAVLESREQERIRKEEAMHSEHTFRPMLSSKTQEYAHMKRYTNRGDMDKLGERLYQDAKQRQTKVSKMMMERAAEELDGMFQPHVQEQHGSPGAEADDAPAALPRRPLHERLDDIKKAKHVKIANLRQKWLHDEDLTFKPQLCPRSRSVETRRDGPGGAECHYDPAAGHRYDDSYINAPGFVQRAWDAHKRSHQDPAAARGDGRGEDEEAHPKHTPAISTRSREMAESNQEYQAYRDFVSRQQYQIQKRDMRLRLKREEAYEEQRLKGTKRSQVEIDRAVHSMMQRAKEGDERLSQRRQAATKGLFRPKINRDGSVGGRGGAAPSQRSQSEGGPVRPGSPRMSAVSRKEADIDKIRQERMEIALREETHKPCIDRRSKKLAEQRRRRLAAEAQSEAGASSIPFSNPSTSKTYERAEEIRRGREAQEASECTFAPKTNRAARGAAHAVPADVRGQGLQISGFQQFIQRQERARHNQEEVQRMKEEMTRGGVKSAAISNAIKRCTTDGKRLHTVPEPFSLSDGMGRAVAHEEYTFRPTTNETHRDRLLQRVLEENGEESFSSRSLSQSRSHEYAHTGARPARTAYDEGHYDERRGHADAHVDAEAYEYGRGVHVPPTATPMHVADFS